MEQWVTYHLLKDKRIMRKGKGHRARRSVDAVEGYLEQRYPKLPWDAFRFAWHFSEAAALKYETRSIDAYMRLTGDHPPWNRVRGGSGRQSCFRCKAYKANGEPCLNDTLEGNYGFCGVHRR
jgi:hypothetical protein